MHPWLHVLLDLLFPPKCIYCQSVVSSLEAGACPACRKQLPWIEPEAVLLPGKLLSKQLSVLWYEGIAREAILRYKFRGQSHYARALSAPLAERLSRHCLERYDP